MTHLPSIEGYAEITYEYDKNESYLPLILFSNYICDLNTDININSVDSPISLENLWSIRDGTTYSHSNNRIDSPEVIIHEILDIPHTNLLILVDITSIDQGRNLIGLEKIAKHTSIRNNNFPIHFCFSSYFPDASNLQTIELGIGVNISDSTGFPALIKCIIDGNQSNVVSILDQYDDVISKNDLLKSIPLLLEISESFGNPLGIVNYFPGFENEKQKKIIIRGIIASKANIETIIHILSQTSVKICIDDICNIKVSKDKPLPPNDDEIIEVLLILKAKGFMNRIILSINIQNKIKLKKFGGPGYRYFTNNFIPRMKKSGFTHSEIKTLVFDNAYNLLKWHVPPIPVDIITVELMKCFWCDRDFPLSSHHYEKFNRLYCSSQCLNSHRKNNWKDK